MRFMGDAAAAQGSVRFCQLPSRQYVIFNVKGNQYRLEVIVAYEVGLVTVVWAGTHDEYDERNRRR